MDFGYEDNSIHSTTLYRAQHTISFASAWLKATSDISFSGVEIAFVLKWVTGTWKTFSGW